MYSQVQMQTQKFDVGTKRAAQKTFMLNLRQVQAESQKGMVGKTMTEQSSLKTGVGKHGMCGYRLGYPSRVRTWCVSLVFALCGRSGQCASASLKKFDLSEYGAGAAQ